jgi:hypothetical protein
MAPEATDWAGMVAQFFTISNISVPAHRPLVSSF